MKHLLPKALFERKQVGLLYHYTSVAAATRILDLGFLESIGDAVCFTRNSNLHKLLPEISSIAVRLTFDGERLSDRHPIVPHDNNYVRLKSGKIVDSGMAYADEFEERIFKKYVAFGAALLGVTVLDANAEEYRLVNLLNVARKKNIAVNLDALKSRMDALEDEGLEELP